MIQAIPVVQSPEVTIVGGILGLSSILSPFLMAWLVNRAAVKRKIDGDARADLVAERLMKRQDEAERKAADVADQAARAAELLVVSNRKQEEIAKVQGAKLDQIHTLVNSNLSAALQDQLDARTATLVILRETVAAKQQFGISPSAETIAAIDANQIKVEELGAQLADRRKRTAEAATQLVADLAKTSNGHAVE